MALEHVDFPCPVRRFLIRIRHERWEIVHEQAVARKTLPASFEFPDAAAERGIIGAWYDAVDARGNTVYRRPIQNPMRPLTEFVDDDEKLSNVLADAPEDLLIAMIPDLPAIEALVFYASDREPIRVNVDSGVVEAKPVAQMTISKNPAGDDDGA